MGKRPHVLFLGHTLPFPPDSGAAIRTYNVLRLLSHEYRISGLCFFRTNEQSTPDRLRQSVAALSEYAAVEAFPIPQEHSRTRFLRDHLTSLARGRAYTAYLYRSNAFRDCLLETLRGQRFDLAHVDSLDLAQYLPLLRDLPVVCVHHNVESSLLRQRAEWERNAATKAYLRLQARLLEKQERHWCPRVDLNVTVSENDRNNLEGRASGRFVVVPNGVDTETFQPARVSEEGLICVGGLDWLANRDGLDFLCKEVLPSVRQYEPAVRVRWIGRADQRLQAHYRSRYGVEVTGYVDDIRPYVAEAACYVVPLRIGGGTRLKVLDGWAMGKAIVSTALGCEGLRVVNNTNALVRDSPAEFAAAVVQVLRDVRLRETLGTAGRATAEREYSWQVIGEKVLAEYSRVLGGSPTPILAT